MNRLRTKKQAPGDAVVEKQQLEIKKEKHKNDPKRDKIVARIGELFPGASAYVTEFRPRGFNIEFQYRDTSFDDLSVLSKTFGTRTINLGSESRQDGYCETCYNSYTVNIIRIDNISDKWCGLE